MTLNISNDWQNGGFGLYVHWPFCAAKCPYCDFNSHVAAHIDHKRWLDAYLRELDRVGRELPNRVLNSIFFGGGTPSLMQPEVVGAVIAKAKQIWPTSNDLEVTLEANPGSVEAGKFAGFRDGGVNRISMGVQALNDYDLKRLGRIHTVAEAKAAFDTARSVFDRVSFDLIYARQDQTPAQWRQELTEALSMAIDHLSLYQLTIEDGTAFGDRYKRGRLRGLPDEDSSAEMYEITQEICDDFGMPRYEISNHARDGAASRHNLIYWRYGDYAGIGPGAHGRITTPEGRFATEAATSPIEWLKRSDLGNTDVSRLELSAIEQAEEYLMMGLRLVDGIDVDRYHALSGHSLNRERLDELVDLELISLTGSKMAATDRGAAILNAVISELLV